MVALVALNVGTQAGSISQAIGARSHITYEWPGVSGSAASGLSR